ncbi:rCG22312 [Rattus norvegicus]|uniref:RCG22312 n=1 Tax=Rattus norvegicus TaxID=10116 RepID=A6IP22_RAT|nr:rCG22312 [Rattus norvegicus]
MFSHLHWSCCGPPSVLHPSSFLSILYPEHFLLWKVTVPLTDV